jgi:hypothetical protein
MNNCFLLYGKNLPVVASAFAPKDIKLSQDLISDLEGRNELAFDLDLVKLSRSSKGLEESYNLTGLSNIWLDYQPNSLAWPMMSEELKTVIDSHLTGNESIDWISAIIKAKTEQKLYYIPRFNKLLDVLDLQKTIFVSGTDHIIKPVFSVAKTSLYAVFPKPTSGDLWKITPSIYVNETLKKSIQKLKLTGLGFEKTTMI